MPRNPLADRLTAGLTELLGIPPDPGRLDDLLNYLELLSRWNRSFNLTSIRDTGQMITRHLLDSLAVMPWVDQGPVLDAGSGAGLPGIPLAIMRPDLQITLLDSAGKKVRFLRQAARQLNLRNIQPVQQRLESWSTEEMYKIIISRAFADLAAFGGAARHLMGAGTRLLAMKGKYPEAELARLPAWLRVDSIEKLQVPGLQEDRHLVIMSLNR